MKIFALIVLGLAGAFSLAMLVVFAFFFAERKKFITYSGNISASIRMLMFFASIANAAVVLLYLLEWNY